MQESKSIPERAKEDGREAAKEEQPTQLVTIQANNGEARKMEVLPTYEVSGLMHKILRWCGVAPANHRLLYERLPLPLDMKMGCIYNRVTLQLM